MWLIVMENYVYEKNQQKTNKPKPTWKQGVKQFAWKIQYSMNFWSFTNMSGILPIVRDTGILIFSSLLLVA